MRDPYPSRELQASNAKRETPNAEWWTVEQEQCIGRHVYYADLRVPVPEVSADL
jgi:hypothetical protein